MMDIPLDFQPGHPHHRNPFSLSGVALVVLLHAAALWLLMSLDVVPTPMSFKPLMVQIIPPQIPAMGAEPAPAAAPTPAQPPKPQTPPKTVTPPRPPKARPRPTPPPKTPPPAPVREMIAAPAESSAAASQNAVAAPPPPPEEPPAPADNAGGSAGGGAGPGGSGPGGMGGPGTQPRFDADYLHNPRPVYPPMSRRMGEEGKVYLRVRVEPDGRLSQVEIKTSSGSARLDQAAEDAVRRWRFIPAKRGGEAVSAWVVVPISFNLKQ